MGSSGAITAPASPVNLTTIAASTVLANKLAASDANPAFQILGDGTLRWGAGGANLIDSALQRTGVGVMTLLAALTVNGTITGANMQSLSFFNANGDISTIGGNFQATPAGKGYLVKEGANARMGASALVAGTVTVANTTVTATTRIFLGVQALGGVAVPTMVGVTARVAGTSFTITSASAADTSTIAWLLMEPL